MLSIEGHPNPPSGEVDGLVDEWRDNPDAFAVALQALKSADNTKALKKQPSVANTMKPGQTMPTDATKKPAAPKGPNLPNQLNAIVKQTEPLATDNESIDDIEVAGLLSTVKQELKKKFNTKGKGWGPGYKKYVTAYDQVTSKTESVKNKSGFLKAALKLLNPAYVPGKGMMSAKPGEFHSMQMPNEPLSPFAQTMGLTPEKKAKAEALQAKVTEYEQLLAKLKAEQKKAQAAMTKAQADKVKLGGVNEKLLKYFSYIEKNCSEYLSAVGAAGGKLLFRGQDDASQPIFVAYPRPDREPKDSDPDAQRLIDKYLNTMGFKALRSNSLFTIANLNHAAGYGTPYAIFPKNGFKFTWSTRHEDLVINSVHDIDDDDGDAEDVSNEYQDWYEEFERYTDYYLDEDVGNNPKKFGLTGKEDDKVTTKFIKQLRAMPEHKKLTAAVNKYAYLDYYDDSAEDFHTMFLTIADAFMEFVNKTGFKLLSTNEDKALKKKMDWAKSETTGKVVDTKKDTAKAARAIKNYGFVHEDLPAALKAGHEVMILGEYIAVDFEKFENEIRTYFAKPAKAKKK